MTLGGLDGYTLGVFTADGCLAIVERMKRPILMTPDLDDPCLGFLLPRQLGRLPTSTNLDNAFLFSEAA